MQLDGKNSYNRFNLDSLEARIDRLETALAFIEHLTADAKIATPSKRLSEIRDHIRGILE